MIALAYYLFKDYLRSFLYVPPVTLFFLWTIVAYTYVPNPVFSSYAVSCAVLYFITAWITVTLINKEETTQLNITAVHAGSIVAVLIGKLLVVIIIVNCLTILAVFYPILIGAFNRSVTIWDVMVAILVHVLISLLSIAISLYFTKIWNKRTRSTWLLLVLILVISLAKGGIVNSLPDSLSFITWVIPPSFTIMEMLPEDAVLLNASLLFNTLYIVSYAILLFAIFFTQLRKRTPL
ncbi:hypothetical protein [Oceanobacillus kapialis]|uniref:ABC transporter permease n=1 Tax=Oceanobacillus kapialis TaxID=481353 RepID=A0ABW5PYV8_9BACI